MSEPASSEVVAIPPRTPAIPEAAAAASVSEEVDTVVVVEDELDEVEANVLEVLVEVEVGCKVTVMTSVAA